MIHPSGVQRPEDVKLEIQEIMTGIFVVNNAYVGDYEYFPGQVLIKNVGNPQDEPADDEKTADESIN
jgi:hypothetical protein